MRHLRQKTTVAVGGAVLALAALAVPATAHAQDGAEGPRTHTVRRGDTLWDLARTYLGDPFLWPDIYRRNTAVVENPHWIYPGEQLVLPDAAQVATRDVPAEPTEPTEPAGTVFTSSTPLMRPSIGPDRLAPAGRGRFTAVRPGEVYAAPFVDRYGGPLRSGSILRNVALSNIRTSLDSQALQLNDEVYVAAPAAQPAAEGERYLVYTLGPRLEGRGQVVVPTGVLVVEYARPREAARARLVQQFGRVVVGQRLLPLTADIPAVGQTAAAVEGSAPTASIVWMQDDPVLPSIQQYVVLDAPSRRGTRVGDEFTLVRPRETVPGSLAIPEESIAVAQVVRVTPYAATAVVLDQRHPAIRVGTRARVTAKMP